MRISEILRDVATKVHREMMEDAIIHTWWGGIRVDPNKVPMSRDEAKDAIDRLRRLRDGVHD